MTRNIDAPSPRVTTSTASAAHRRKSRRSSDAGGKIDTSPANAGPQRYLLVRQKVEARRPGRRTARRWRNEVRSFRYVTPARRVGHLVGRLGWGRLCPCGRRALDYDADHHKLRLVPAAVERWLRGISCLSHV